MSQTEQPGRSLSANFRSDLLASIVVFLVALPLCMGVALASGAPVAAGLITGIVGGLVVGWLAGCPLQVSGPAAGLTVIVYDIIQRHGLEELGLAVLLAGLIQMVSGLLKLGQWFRAVSPAVIKGMLAGIGFLLLGSQLHVMIDDQPKGTGAQNLAGIPSAVWKSLAPPTFQAEDVREFRIHALREVGELHRWQVNIHERVSELARYEAEEESVHPDSPGPVAPMETTEELSRQQADLHARLAEVVAQLDAFERHTKHTKRSARICSSAELALRQNSNALDALGAGDIKQEARSQKKAVASLETLLASLKNHHLAAYTGVFTIVLILLWQGFAPRRLKIVPAPLLAVGLVTFAATMLAMPVLYVEAPDKLWEDIHLPVLTIHSTPWITIFQLAMLLAVVASAETLLCATAVDQMTDGSRTNYDRELFAQGVGNLICGFLGALPMTGVIVRSSANVRAGAKSRLSAVLHGAWLLLFVVALGFALRLIPTSSLAAILVYTGYKLINLKAILELRRYGWGEVVIFLATVTTIVFADLLTGVLVGVGLSAVKLLHTFSHLTTGLDIDPAGKTAVLSLRGAATFVRLPILAAQLEKVPAGVQLHVDFEHLDYIDHSCLDLLMNWAKQHAATGGELVIDWNALHGRFDRRASERSLAGPRIAAKPQGELVAHGAPADR